MGALWQRSATEPVAVAWPPVLGATHPTDNTDDEGMVLVIREDGRMAWAWMGNLALVAPFDPWSSGLQAIRHAKAPR